MEPRLGSRMGSAQPGLLPPAAATRQARACRPPDRMVTHMNPRSGDGPGTDLGPGEFLRLLLPNAEDLDGRLNIYTLPDRHSYWFAPTDLDAAAARALALAEIRDVYFGLGLVDLVAREQEARAALIRKG